MREVSAALPGPANGTFREECSDTFADFAALVHFVFPMTRGRWFGLARREMDIRGYQMHQMVVALMAWKIRTGGDTSEFLGQWEPPERARRRKAA